MNREKAIQFCRRYSSKQFYQPVVFVPGVIEIKGKWNDATKELADIVLDGCSGKSVLDLGCMHGFFLYEALKKGASYAVGVDHDVVEMELAREIRDILQFHVDLVEEKIEEYDSDFFDIILMMNVTHVLNNPKDIIDKFLKFAKDRMAVEYLSGQDNLFSCPPNKILNSPRAAGHRKLALFEVRQG